jgi:hypothetical protein
MSILALTSDTLIGTAAAGNIEYNGQFFGTDSNASRAQLQRIVQGTAVASTSGTSIDFTSLPAWVKKITVMLASNSTNGVSDVVFRIGSGSVASTGYLGSSWNSAGSWVASTDGWHLSSGNAAAIVHGNIVITQLNAASYIWTAAGNFSRSDNASGNLVSGSCTLSGVLDRVRITTVNGTDTFDSGSVNIIYEG